MVYTSKKRATKPYNLFCKNYLTCVSLWIHCKILKTYVFFLCFLFFEQIATIPGHTHVKILVVERSSQPDTNNYRMGSTIWLSWLHTSMDQSFTVRPNAKLVHSDYTGKERWISPISARSISMFLLFRTNFKLVSEFICIYSCIDSSFLYI